MMCSPPKLERTLPNGSVGWPSMLVSSLPAVSQLHLPIAALTLLPGFALGRIRRLKGPLAHGKGDMLLGGGGSGLESRWLV